MKKLLLLAGVGAALALGACGNDESREDADDVPNGSIDKSQPHVNAFNNHFGNIQHKCLTDAGTNDVDPGDASIGIGLRVIQSSDGHGSRLVVIPDPHCPGYMPEQANTEAVGGNAQ